MIEYKNFYIEPFGMSDDEGYTVFYNGDDYYFSTIEEAKQFIDTL